MGEEPPPGNAAPLEDDQRKSNLEQGSENDTDELGHETPAPAFELSQGSLRPQDWEDPVAGHDATGSARIGYGILRGIRGGLHAQGLEGSAYEEWCRIAGAEIAAVEGGRKPLFHENIFPDAEDAREAAEALRANLDHRLKVESFETHLVIYDPVQVSRIMASDPEHYGEDVSAAVLKAVESDEVGELLGYGARFRTDADLLVEFRVRNLKAGFMTRSSEADAFIAARARDYAVLGAVTINTKRISPPAFRSAKVASTVREDASLNREDGGGSGEDASSGGTGRDVEPPSSSTGSGDVSVGGDPEKPPPNAGALTHGYENSALGRSKAERRWENDMLASLPPRGAKLVSRLLKFDMTDDAFREVLMKGALLVDSVHDSGALKEVTVSDRVPPDEDGSIPNGVYRPAGTRRALAELAVSRETQHPLLTMIHEIGHHVAKLLGSKAVERVVDAVKGTRHFDNIVRHADKEGHSYLMKPEEIFCRAYAQYVVTRTAGLKIDFEGVDELQRMQEDFDEWFQVWDASEFSGVKDALVKELQMKFKLVQSTQPL